MNQTNDVLSYLNFLKVIYHRRYIFLAVAMLVTALVTCYAYTLPKKYRADSTVFIEKNVISKLVKGLAVSPDIRNRIRVLRYALSSRELISRVLIDMDSEIFTKSKAEQQSFIDDLKKRTRISVRGQDLFKVSLTDKNPAFAQTYVNTLVGKYVEENISSKRDETYGANRFLTEQIDLFKSKLDVAEEAIIQFRKKSGIYFSLDEKGTLRNIKSLSVKIENLDLTLDTLEPRRRSLQRQLRSLSPTVETVEMFGSSDFLGSDESELSKKEDQLQQLLVRYTENHPSVVVLMADIEELKKRVAENEADFSLIDDEITEESLTGSELYNMGSGNMTSMPNPIYQQVKQEIISIGAEIATLQAKKRSLRQLIKQKENSLREIPEKRKDLGVLIQERNSAKQIYQELLKRMSQSEVSKQMEIGNKSATFRIVDPALFPETPVSPNMARMILLAIVAGLGCGFGVIFLLDWIDSSIKNPNQLKSLGIKILATIPNIDDGVTAARDHKTDVLVYSITSLYYTVIIAILGCELLHIEVIEHLKTLAS